MAIVRLWLVALCVARLFASCLSFTMRLNKMPHCTKMIASLQDQNEWEIKRYPSDFVVIEDGCISTSDDSIVDAKDEASMEKEEKKSSEAESVHSFREILTQEQLDNLETLSNGEGELESAVLEITPSLSKEQRTLFHQQFIRNEYPSLDSKTETGHSLVDYTKILVHRKGARSIEVGEVGGLRESKGVGKRRGKGRRKAVVQRWDKSKPDYLHFTLHKSQLTTDEALELLARKTGVLPTRFGVSGSKDRFAVTAQRVSAWRLERSVLEQYIEDTQARKQNDQLVQVELCDVGTGARALSLGALRGNIFALRLRPIGSTRAPREQVQTLVRTLEEQRAPGGEVPFLNIFGPQRFGSPLPVNVAVGKACLQEDYAKAVLLLLLCPGTEREARLLGPGGLDSLYRWLSPPGGGSVLSSEAHFNALQASWAAHVTAVESDIRIGEAERQDRAEIEGENEEGEEEAKRSSGRGRGGDRSGTKTLTRRVAFLSALLGTAPLPVEGGTLSLEVPRAFPFSQRKLADHVLAQLRGVELMPGLEEEQDKRVTWAAISRVDFRKAFSQALPRHLRLLFVNAYQSCLFNQQAEHRALTLSESAPALALAGGAGAGAGAEAGDMVLVDGQGGPLSAWEVSERNVSLIATELEFFNRAEIEGERGGGGAGAGAGGDGGDKSQAKGYLHLVTEQEQQEGIFGLEHVVAALPGHATSTSLLPATMQVQIEQEDGCLALLRGRHSDAMYRLPGAYRHVVSQARNFRVAEGPLAYPAPSPHKDEDGDDGSESKGKGEELQMVVEARYRDGSLGSMVRALRDMRRGDEGAIGKAMRGHGEEGDGDSNDVEKEEEEKEAVVELLFSLCSSSYATSFVSSLLQGES